VLATFKLLLTDSAFIWLMQTLRPQIGFTCQATFFFSKQSVDFDNSPKMGERTYISKMPLLKMNLIYTPLKEQIMNVIKNCWTSFRQQPEKVLQMTYRFHSTSIASTD